MLKKILSILFIFSLLLMQTSVLASEEYELEFSHSKKDYSSSGGKVYRAQSTQEQLQAREDAKKIYSSPVGEMSVSMVPLFDDWTSREAQAKVSNIGTKILLANNLDDFVRFSVSPKKVVNAYATYGGVVEVYKGLLDYVETEDELAYVIAHELGHIYKKDPRTGMITKGVILGTILTGGLLTTSNNSATRNTGGGIIVAGAGGLLATPKMQKFQETRADLNGIDFMVKAGYNPLASISMMNKILNRTWDILSDHPSGDKRMLKAYDYIKSKYPKYLEGGYDTISYERAIKYIIKRKAEIYAKQTKSKNKKSVDNKKINNEQQEDDL